MFYSQFILAKKGPLGTIWIAAHLERKLRKNQVADTDIGVSVDSILFPDVPIALRLSSHLLLGVVRIYSRKVNYLFDDCSEALLKVKQAFRSTAVDLPPEESKAPYHSITLPETFDLDDFELPDNDIFQGNYVDHHISSREQITLQDNMEGAVYSTSQFGLDERFGDGDTSGLDLDEELLMAKVEVAGYSGLSADPQASVNSMTLVKQDEHDEMMHANTETQMADVAGDADLMDYAEAPPTPGLVEQPNLSNVQETSGCDDHVETEENHLTESANLHQGDEHIMDWSIPSDKNSVDVPCNGYHSNDMGFKKGFTSPTEIVAVEHISSENAVATGPPFEAEIEVYHDKPLLASKLIRASDRLDREEESQNGNVKVDTGDVAHEDRDPNSTISEEILEGGIEKSYDVKNAGDTVSSRNSSSTELRDASVLEKDEVPNGQFRILRPCNAVLDEPGPSQSEAATSVTIDVAQLETSEKVEVSQSSVVQGDMGNSINYSEQILKEKYIIQPPSSEDICLGSDKSVDLGNTNIQVGGPLVNINMSAGIDCPAPEKMRSAPEGFVDEQRNLLMEVTPGDVAAIDESDAGSRIVSGKKRSYTESTLTEKSLNSVESSRAARTKKAVEAIPDDDDLLSSILVGRRSSVLKLKPTPPPSEITSLKRHRTAPRTSTSKRKMLLDDTMVLHGDTIRQQLMNTEDIRRLRKKAPCTRPEIAMIQRQFLEDQIFEGSLFSGVSIHLASLHNQKYDLSRIIVSQAEVNSSILAGEQKLTCENDEGAENLIAENALDSSRQTAVLLGVGGSELEAVRENDEIQTAEISDFNDNKRSGNSEPIVDANITELQLKPIEDLVSTDHGRLQIEHSQNLAESEIDGGSNSIAGAGNLAFPVFIEPSDRVDVFQPALEDNRGEFDASVQMGELAVSSDEKRGLERVEMDALVMEGITGMVNNDVYGTVNVGDVIASVETGHSARDGVSQEACQGADTIEISRDTPVEYNDPAPSVEIEADVDGIRMDNHRQIHDGIPGEEPIITASYPAENFTLQEGEQIMLHESNLGNIVDADFSGINTHDHDDIYYTCAANDTDFLNVDDDEIAEVTDDYIPEAEETRLTENSGWSSRTRAVAKYLQTLFVKEAECGRKAGLPMDNLLVGKTRKEASRMFFEALVLKTRDYVHVEQPCPFDNITLKPKPKLVKSDFLAQDFKLGDA